MTFSRKSAVRRARFFSAAVCIISALWSDRGIGQTERILSFDSRITLHENGGLTVRETIQVVAAGDKIKRGIYRDFPTEYRDRHNQKYVVEFQPIQVLRDGKTESFHTEKLSNGMRVYFGRSDVYLEPGAVTYTFTFQTDHQLGFFKDYDELYWNVTGNGWDFDIEKASAVVELPENMRGRVRDTNAWTGVSGSVDRAFRMDAGAWPLPRFETTRPLAPGEGFTIVVSWPKGLIPEPAWNEKALRTLKHNVGLGIALVGTLLLLVYYITVWTKVGRDPEKGTVVPQFSAPEGMSPAAVRYLYRMGYDHKTFASALLSMAVKNFLKIEEKGGVYTLTRQKADTGNLSPEERKIAEAMLLDKSSIELKQANHASIQKALQDLKNSLKFKFHKTYFFTNRGYFVPGILFSIAMLVAATLSFGNPEAGFLTVWLSVWSAGVAVLLAVVTQAWKAAFEGRAKTSAMGVAIGLTLFSIPFLAAEAFGLYGLSASTSPLLIASLVIVVAVNMLFYHLLKAPTLLGRKTLDRLEGFKMYLGAAEKERLKWTVPPDKTPETFERFLPYALALGVEQEWAEKFSNVLAAAGRGDSTSSYHPVWYQGSALKSFNPASFATSFSGSFSSAISSSSTAPGSSSGSSGGSSGGGGGGGGGGGW